MNLKPLIKFSQRSIAGKIDIASTTQHYSIDSSKVNNPSINHNQNDSAIQTTNWPKANQSVLKALKK